MIINAIPLTILIIYAALTLGAANMVLRKKLGSDHFLVAARSLPLYLVVAVLAGDMIGGASTVGVTQRGYSEGVVAILVSIGAGLAFFVFAATMSGRFRKLKPVTIPEVIGKLFDTRTRFTTALVIGISYFFLAVAQIMAGGALLSALLGMKIWIAEVITMLIFAVIVITGGLRSIALVNIVQIIVLITGMFASAVFSLILIGGSVSAGIGRIWNELPPSYWSFSLSRSPWTWSGEMLGAIFTLFAAQAAITGIFAARDHKTAVQGAWLAGLVCMSVGIPFTVLGMCAKIHFGTALPYGLSAAPAMMLALNP
ncbi:MAG: sodium:solute symporter family protein, partial [Candidatus Latescibacterota bacterium]